MIEMLARFVDDPTVSAVLLAMAGAVIGLWLAGAWWAFSDASRRTDSELARFLAAGWVILSTPVLLPLSLAVYTLVRPQTTVGELRSRALAAQLGPLIAEEASCGACGAATDPGWRRCPSCTEWLQAPCAHCSAWSDIELEHCPYCGSESLDLPGVSTLPLEPVAAVGPTLESPGVAAFIATGRAATDAAGEPVAAIDEAQPAAFAAVAHADRRAFRRDASRRDGLPAREAPTNQETPGARRVRRSGPRLAGGRIVRTSP